MEKQISKMAIINSWAKMKKQNQLLKKIGLFLFFTNYLLIFLEVYLIPYLITAMGEEDLLVLWDKNKINIESMPFKIIYWTIKALIMLITIISFYPIWFFFGGRGFWKKWSKKADNYANFFYFKNFKEKDLAKENINYFLALIKKGKKNLKSKKIILTLIGFLYLLSSAWYFAFWSFL